LDVLLNFDFLIVTTFGGFFDSGKRFGSAGFGASLFTRRTLRERRESKRLFDIGLGSIKMGTK
jgi:hypothetical protein